MCFNLFDKDQSGSISADELRQLLGRSKTTDPLVKNLIKEADASGDGEIDLKEFKDLMLKIF